jgi:formylglycine-generating enzyme required for sulfatase activity
MTRPLRVFLCHASQDKPTVWKLHRYLKQHGIKPWLDREDLLPGEDWEVEIPRALFASDVILVCLSKNSVNKEGFVQKEITFALDKAQEKPEGTIFIIPIKLEECEIPKRLNRYHWVDLSRPDGRRRLLMGLNKRVNDLGDEVQQIVLEDTRQRKPAFKSVDSAPVDHDEIEKAELEAREGLKREAAEKTAREKLELDIIEKTKRENASLQEEQKEEKQLPRGPKDIPNPPKASDVLVGTYQDLKEKSPEELKQEPTPFKGASFSKDKQSGLNIRLFGIGGIILFVLIFGGFGLNYLIKNLPVATGTKFSPSSTPSSLGIGSTMIGEKGEALVYVPAGEFTMGDKSNSNSPIHTVYLDAFWIDQTEVTNKQYKACVDAGTCEPPSSASSYSHPNYYGNPEFDNYPVIFVSWDKANRYCEVWTDGDLPTEAQWEKAARGTDARIYPWGNDPPSKDLLNYNGNIGDASVVKNYPNTASFYSTYDMAGNVWEWVNDYYGETYYQSSNLTNNPLGPESGQYRVLRGGSWNVIVNGVRSAFRYWNVPSNSSNYLGFRCSRSP